VKLNTEVKPGRKVKKWETASGAIVQDTNRCVGCRRCETSCTLLNDKKVSAKISRIKIARNQNYGRDGVTGSYGFGDGQLGNFRIIADTCRQCSQPKCGDNCPVGAIVVDKKTKARVVDEKKCIGCGSCARSCPWQIATLDPETVVATKCLLCNGSPNCVKNCPTGAIKFYPWKEAEKLLFPVDATSAASKA
jgi:Fe-S-cluster-containing dehydrogenase component